MCGLKGGFFLLNGLSEKNHKTAVNYLILDIWEKISQSKVKSCGVGTLAVEKYSRWPRFWVSVCLLLDSSRLYFANEDPTLTTSVLMPKKANVG